jgi:hypothetical protein
MLCVLRQGAAVGEVASILGCKKSTAKTLLLHYMWDQEKLLGARWRGSRACRRRGVTLMQDACEIA